MIHSNGEDELSTNRIAVATHFAGKLIMIWNHDDYEDIFGLHLGCYMVPKWDPTGKYIFHSILSSHDGAVHNYCIRTSEGSHMIKVIL